ncbi:ABC transporter permease [Mycobacterium sp. Marseille-P9652]|uniref:ABC transporter permease n=1 Tax=Mycobacterium sp. Marseille-P9652 TaxID=2654950 RepID=UPI0018D0B3FB|nr:ABC transporter permease [Mycobacterium sp. Marseille-P9652]
MSTDAPLRSSLSGETLVFAGQLLTRWQRQPAMLIEGLVYPTFLLITFKLLLGKSILRITGTESLYGLVPMCAVVGAMLGAIAAGRHMTWERDGGLIGRFWVSPVHRASALTGRLLAEVVRTLMSSVLITAVGIGLGLRFKNGWLAAIPFMLVPVLVIVVFSMAVIAVAVRAKTGAVLSWLGIPATGLVFASSGFVPPQALPSPVRLNIQLQPMWGPIEAMRALAQGGPVLWPLLLSAMWAVGLAAALGPLAVRGYRAAAENPH